MIIVAVLKKVKLLCNGEHQDDTKQNSKGDDSQYDPQHYEMS